MVPNCQYFVVAALLRGDFDSNFSHLQAILFVVYLFFRLIKLRELVEHSKLASYTHLPAAQ